MNIVVVIPSLNPTEQLSVLIAKLVECGMRKIVIVNDGSLAQTGNIFHTIQEKHPLCKILTHAVNLGKGRALKTAFNFILQEYSDSIGIVTADADGQHTAEDINLIAKTLKQHQQHMVLGARQFEQHVPWKSKLGNTLTRYIFRVIVGKNLSDTQTGLRGIPTKYLPLFLKLDGERYEYELNMLISAKRKHIHIIEQPIQTIYIENNQGSHFNPLFDSIKIYFVLLRFSVSAIIASVLDVLMFSLFYTIFQLAIFPSLILSRCLVSAINFYLNRKYVFLNSKTLVHSVIKYYALLLFLAYLAYTLINAFHSYLGITILTAKICAESLLFIINFTLQRDYIFNDEN